MIDGLKPYPAMKDSGVPWLGEVPEHWGVAQAEALCSRSGRTSTPERPLLSVSERRAHRP